MSNYIEYGDKVAFHPGYYIKEIIDDSGLTQADFARRLGTTPKNISVLLKGEQSLSVDIANKLSMMLGTSISYWLNLQQAYDVLNAEFMRSKELERERDTFRMIDYGYFRDNMGLPDLPRKVDEQIESVRKFLSLSSLSVLEDKDLAVDFRGYKEELSRTKIVNSNVMAQIAINETLQANIPQFDRKKFEARVDRLLLQTKNHERFLDETKTSLEEVGVYLVVLPNLKNSGISGATKRVNGRVMILVNDRRHYEDTFWFTLFHEIGHVLNGNLGATSERESEADEFARRMLIPEEAYCDFIKNFDYSDEKNIRAFAYSIDRDPGIVVGRLLIEHKINNSEVSLCNKYRHIFDVTREINN